MDRRELAAQLRDRLVRHTHLTDKEVVDISDTEVIDAYITCSCCGEKMITSVQLNEVIEKSHNASDFIYLTETEKTSHIN